MKTFKFTKLSLLFFVLTTNHLLLTTPGLYAVQIHPKAGSTSAAFLKLGVGSRATAMGSSFVGLADDVTAMYWNPAGLAYLKNRELHLTHNEVFENIRHDFAAYSFPKWNGVCGIALFGLYTPSDIERRSGLNEADPFEPISPVEGLFAAYDMAVQASYSRLYRKNLAFGASFKVIKQTIDTESAYGAAIDLGALYKFENMPLSAGFMLQHLGTPIKFIRTAYDLPLNMKLGAAYRWNEKLVTTFDLNQPNDNYMFISAGSEYNLLKFMAVRAGYRYRLNGLELGDLSGLSVGIGFTFPFADSTMKFDYAFLPYGVLGNSHRVSIGIEFGHASSYIPVTAAEQKKQKPAAAASAAQGPVAPPPARYTVPAAAPLDGYSVFKTTVSAKLKMVNGRAAMYKVTAQSSESAVYTINGEMRLKSDQDLALNIGEKAGASGSKVFRTFAFSINVPDPFSQVTIYLRLPKELRNPAVKLASDNSMLKLNNISEGGDAVYYFKLSKLQEFSVITE